MAPLLPWVVVAMCGASLGASVALTEEEPMLETEGACAAPGRCSSSLLQARRAGQVLESFGGEVEEGEEEQEELLSLESEDEAARARRISELGGLEEEGGAGKEEENEEEQEEEEEQVTLKEYVPGEPGAPWTKSEMLKVRAKLHRVFHEGQSVYKELGHELRGWGEMPSKAKALRLGFHDCLKYKDGTGGCDGCLEWHGVGDRFNTPSKGIYPADGQDGHNNGLGPITAVLEAIYTKRDYPKKTATLQHSLRATGKSRADLWAFAAIIAAERSMEFNDWVCDNPVKFKNWPYNTCHPREGQSDCKAKAPRKFVFKSGRRDCISNGTWDRDPHSYKTAKEESHPSASTNGHGTVDFFKRDFGFTGRETVAIMGAHNIGGLNFGHSKYRYTWKAKSGGLLNNGYFRNLAKRRDWYFPSSTGTSNCVISGNATGDRPVARWVPHVRGDDVAGGPVQWIQEKLVCGNWPTGKDAPKTPKAPTCDKLGWRFVMGVDETALPCEMGLSVDFKVDENGIPYGCKGFEQFNLKSWKRGPGGGLKNYHLTWTRVNNQKAEPECPRTMIREPASEKPTSEIVEEYADDQAAFLRDFVPTLEKMLANGYDAGELTASPAEGMCYNCPLQDIWISNRFYNCHQATC